MCLQLIEARAYHLSVNVVAPQGNLSSKQPIHAGAALMACVPYCCCRQHHIQLLSSVQAQPGHRLMQVSDACQIHFDKLLSALCRSVLDP